MQSIQFLIIGACVVTVVGCGGGSPALPTTDAGQIQYVPRVGKVGDERVYQLTDTYSDGSSRTYTRKRVLTQLGADGSSTTQIFDANNILVEIDTIDGNHILSTASISSTGTRTCTDGQAQPYFARPFTIGETFDGSYTGSCAPDGLTAVVNASGRIAAAEKVSVNGVDYMTLKGLITNETTVTYPVSGSTSSYSYTDTQTDWNDTDLGIIVRIDVARSYAGNAPAMRLVSRSRILMIYVNK